MLCCRGNTQDERERKRVLAITQAEKCKRGCEDSVQRVESGLLKMLSTCSQLRFWTMHAKACLAPSLAAIPHPDLLRPG